MDEYASPGRLTDARPPAGFEHRLAPPGSPRRGFLCAYPCWGTSQHVKDQASKNGASADEHEEIAE